MSYGETTMDRIGFLQKLFNFFGKEINEKNKKVLIDYDIALTTNKKIDWNKLYTICIQEAEKRFLPMPSWIVSKLDKCIIVEQGDVKINGGTGVLKFAIIDKSTGEVVKRPTYEYDMTNCPYSLPEIKAKFRAKFKGAFDDFVYYPPYMKVIGNTIVDMREEEDAS